MNKFLRSPLRSSLKSDRRGSFKLGKEMFLWFLRFLVIFTVVFVIMAIFGGYFSRKLETDEIQQYVLRQRILLSENCLAYTNEKTYGGVIDIQKFDEIRLNDCLKYYSYTKNGVGIKLNLTYKSIEKDVDINEDMSKKMDFCAYEKQFSCSNNNYYVLVYDNGFYIGNLNVKMIKLK